MIVSYSIIAAITVLVGLSVLFSLSSPLFLWAILGQFQLLILLPLTTAYIHPDVIDYFKGFDFALLSMSYIPNIDISLFGLGTIDYDQNDAYLNDIGLESGSALVNISSMISFALVIIPIHIAILTVYK
jgi:hypothetical protein